MSVELPAKLGPLFDPARYKVVYGGRGGGKSWGVARALLLLSVQRPMRILCAREYQSSIDESVHRLLADQITDLGLDDFFEVQAKKIYGKNGSEFFFLGIKTNPKKIKSTENVSICWVEEADQVSEQSWQFLTPTIRAENSEIWVTFNPHFEADATYQRFVVTPPPGAIVIKMNGTDNPWFPDSLREDRDEMRAKNPDLAAHIWDGECQKILDGAVYAEELRELRGAGRITSVPYDPSVPVSTAWDLGWADETAIWIAQWVRGEIHLIEYLSGSGKPVGWYLHELQSRPYLYKTHWLPHDAKAKQLGTGLSTEEQLRQLGAPVRIVPRLSVFDGINAARLLFPRAWMDATKCAEGLRCLEGYHYAVNKDGQRANTPEHDWSSHGADAFRYLAVASTQDAKAQSQVKAPVVARNGGLNEGAGWMT